jgi:hypothetical protein
MKTISLPPEERDGQWSEVVSIPVAGKKSVVKY